MRITVLYGGPSAERAVSLVSGAAVIDALKKMGHDVFPSDIAPNNLAGLDHPADVIFPVLHGEFGESGELQDILESRRLPFVGSGSKASRVAIDKAATKRVWEAAGLPTPPYAVADASTLAASLAKIGAPCVIKALDSGSSIDVYISKTLPDADEAARKVLSRHKSVLIEKFIRGPELTVGLLEEQPLAPIRIVPAGGHEFFDYEAKYQDKRTEHRFDTGLPAAVIELCKSLAKKANDVLGCRDLGRIDIMLDDANNPYLLEMNTLPGFTPTSLLPEAANHAGIPFGPLVDRLAKRAATRGG